MKPRVGRCVLFTVLAFTIGAEAALPGTSAVAPVGPEAYASARSCATCHQTIHLYWSESPHSRSASKPSYQEALRTAVEGASDKEAVRRGCVWCHAPTALVTADYQIERPITKEGVNCDFCHTVADVDLEKPGHPFDLKPGNVKRGPLEYAKVPSHETAYSALHKSSALLCAACHQHTNGLGVEVLSTYSEWKAGPYPARGETCQECHLPLVPGRIVREGLSSTQRRINLHRMVGGSEATRVRGGLELRFAGLDIAGASADVQIVVANTGVGHALPGGLSSKSLVLAVGVETAASGEMMHRAERLYRRELKDAQGRPLASVPDLFLKAASVGEDTRLKPKESRTERFTVPLPEGWKAIVARLEYRDVSDPKAGPQTTMITEVRRERGR
jgi:Cytochrome c554 and c-prime